LFFQQISSFFDDSHSKNKKRIIKNDLFYLF
jgi:hypothetical protein